MTESLAKWFTDVLGGIPPELVIFIISMIPILELRGGLIAAALLGVDIVPAIAICLVGNILPVPFILWFITPIFNWLKRTRLFRPLVEKLEKKSMGKSDKIQKYEFIGLILFVGIPLPGTGAWTGALIASLLNIPFKKAFPAILIGLLLATTIMCVITYLIPWLITLFYISNCSTLSALFSPVNKALRPWDFRRISPQILQETFFILSFSVNFQMIWTFRAKACIMRKEAGQAVMPGGCPPAGVFFKNGPTAVNATLGVGGIAFNAGQKNKKAHWQPAGARWADRAHILYAAAQSESRGSAFGF